MNDDGTCPVCGDHVESQAELPADVDEKAPWHFKLLVVAVVAYLGWRLVQLVA
jgi:hypothetical protein